MTFAKENFVTLVRNYSSLETLVSKVFHSLCNLQSHKKQMQQNFGLELFLDICLLNSKHH